MLRKDYIAGLEEIRKQVKQIGAARSTRTMRTRASSGAAVCGCAQKSSGLSESGQQKGSETMMITQQQMMMVLERHEPWRWVATVWQKLTNGKLVKFIDWSWKHR